MALLSHTNKIAIWTRSALPFSCRQRASISLAAIGLLGVFLTGCGRAPQRDAPGTNIVAQVAGRVITADQLRAALATHARTAAAQPTTSAQKEAALDELLRAEAVYAKALASGFDQRPDIAEATRRLVIARFQEEQMSHLAGKPLQVSDAEIQARYRQDTAKYSVSETVSGAVIYLEISPKATAEKRRERQSTAEQLRERAERGEFEALAAQFSDDQATRYRGGATGWLRRGSATQGWEQEVVDGLFALTEVGTVGPVISTPKGCYLIKLTGRRAAGSRPLEEVRPAIQQELLRAKEADRQRAFHAAMRAGLDIRINRAVLDSISLPATEDTPPAPPGAQASETIRQKP